MSSEAAHTAAVSLSVCVCAFVIYCVYTRTPKHTHTHTHTLLHGYFECLPRLWVALDSDGLDSVGVLWVMWRLRVVRQDQNLIKPNKYI